MHDASDADWSVSQRAAADWEPPSAETQTPRIDADGTVEEMLTQALTGLATEGLAARPTS